MLFLVVYSLWVRTNSSHAKKIDENTVAELQLEHSVMAFLVSQVRFLRLKILGDSYAGHILLLGHVRC